jgi:hypothetical protein
MFQKNVVDKIKTHISYSITFFENRSVYEIMWKKYGTARQATDDNIIRRMRFARWVTKATDTHPEYVILIAFPRQQWLRERASLLGHTYIANLVYNMSFHLCPMLVVVCHERYIMLAGDSALYNSPVCLR